MKPTSAAAFQHLLLLLLLLATEIYGHRFSTSLSLGCFHPNHTNCLFVYRKHFVPILTYAEAWEACEARLSRLAQFRTEGQFGWFRRQFARVRDEICCAQDTVKRWKFRENKPDVVLNIEMLFSGNIQIFSIPVSEENWFKISWFNWF